MKSDATSGPKTVRGAVPRGRFFAALFLMAVAHGGSVNAQDATEQNRLYQQMVRAPQNHDVTFEFARVATARGDFEAAIGALERLLYYNPRLTRVKYELGALYFRLGSFAMARRYFKEALESRDLDDITRRRIETYLPDADKQLQASRLSGFVQTGLRSQSNASFAPSSGTLRLGGGDLTLLPTAQRKSDLNWFGLAGISHDYDINTRGDVLETRFAGYLTQQERFSQLNVGLFDVSIGPRLAVASELLPGLTIKPYVVGGNTWVDDRSYLSSGGAGISARMPINERFTLGPEFEWRRYDYKTQGLGFVSAFDSHDSYTGAFTAGVLITQQIKLDGRGFYRRGEAQFRDQSFDQWGVEAALTFEFAPPFVEMSRNWSVSPYLKYIDTRFDAPNPFIDPFTIHRDRQVSVGALFNTPFNRTFGWTTAIQYDNVGSSLPNYRLNNFTVISGPTARF